MTNMGTLNKQAMLADKQAIKRLTRFTVKDGQIFDWEETIT